MRRFCCLLVLVLAVPSVGAGVKDSCVYVERTDADAVNSGSGTVIAQEDGKCLILSAAHVVPDGGTGLKVRAKGKVLDAAYLAGSKVTLTPTGPNAFSIAIAGPDLVLVVVEADLPPVELAKEAPAKGDRLRQWGFAGGWLGKGAIHKVGKVTDPDGLIGTVDARPGDSGAGLFDDFDQLVGVTSARPLDPNEKAVYAEPIGAVRDFLTSGDRLKGFPKLKQRLTGRMPPPKW